MRDFSIVNGCQTTVLLSQAVDSVPDDVEVLAKIVNPESRVIDRIIEFTNFQNQIKAWDIKSQDKVQRRLKQELEDLPTPFFYAIRKGEFESLAPSAKRKYKSNGQKRAIRFDSLAQHLAAFRGRAYHAYKFKARLFETLYREIFPEDIDAKQVVFVWQLGEIVRGFVREELTSATANNDQENIRILKKGCRIYLLATVSTLLTLRNGATYLSRAADGKPIGHGRREKLRKYCEWALDWYEEAVKSMTKDPAQDLGTLVRQEDFAQRVNEYAAKEFGRLKRAPKFLDEAIPRLLPTS